MFLKRKKDFPIFQSHPELIYLDNAATTHKPRTVIAAEQQWYETLNANVSRGVYALSEAATIAIEGVRCLVRDFLGAKTEQSIVFTKGTTESLNMVATAWASHHLKRGDGILLTQMEHHANLVPWQLVAQRHGFKLRYWPIDSQGRLEQKISMDELFNGVKVLSLTHVSNVLGTINPLGEIIQRAQKRGIVTVVDAAQSIGHLGFDVGKMPADFVAFSGHKMFGPTGVGVLYVRPERFLELHPYQAGGHMISHVSWKHTDFQPMPAFLEAGTLPLAQIYGLGEAIRYIRSLGWQKITEHEEGLTEYALEQLRSCKDIHLYGPKLSDRIGLFIFSVQDLHAHDLATFLDQHHIAVRAGHHCCQPLHDLLGIPASVRVSFSIYNTKRDVDSLIQALQSILKQWKNSILTSS